MVCSMPDFETVYFLWREDVSPTPNPHLPQNLSAWVSLPVEFTAARKRRNPAKFSINKVEIPSREIVIIRITYSLTYYHIYVLTLLTYFTHLLTYLLTHSLYSPTHLLYSLFFFLSFFLFFFLIHSREQSPSWEANRCSASQEIPSILWNRKVHCLIHMCSLLIYRYSFSVFPRSTIFLYAFCPWPVCPQHEIRLLRCGFRSNVTWLCQRGINRG